MKPDMLGDPVEAGAVRATAASRRCRGRRCAARTARKMPITIIAMTLATAPIALPTALVRRPTEPSSWLPRSVGCPVRHQAERCRRTPSAGRTAAVTTSRSASAWAAMVVPANQNTQPMKPKPRMRISSSRQPRADRQEAAEQAHAAVEEHGEDRAADDQQQRLGEEDDSGDGERHAEPDRRLRHFAADERIAEFRRARPLDVRLGRSAALASGGISCSGATFRRGPGGSASNQLSGFHHRSMPSSEKVMNSARPPIFSHGTGPPRPPCHSGTRLSAESSRLSPIRQTWPAGTVTGPKLSSAESAELDRVVGAAVGQRLANHGHAAIDLAVARRARGNRRASDRLVDPHGELASIGTMSGARPRASPAGR